jgi:hypothetical protein
VLLDTVQINLRIKEAFRRQLEREAEAHRVSLNKEMQMRLEDSFTQSATRQLDSISADMAVAWARFSDRFLLLSLENDLAEALAQSTDPKVMALARAWLHTRKMKAKG